MMLTWIRFWRASSLEISRYSASIIDYYATLRILTWRPWFSIRYEHLLANWSMARWNSIRNPRRRRFLVDVLAIYMIWWCMDDIGIEIDVEERQVRKDRWLGRQKREIEWMKEKEGDRFLRYTLLFISIRTFMGNTIFYCQLLKLYAFVL